MARFQTARTVRVSVQPSQFLTAVSFASVTVPTMVDPGENPAEMELKVSRCHGAPAAETTTLTAGESEAGAVPPRLRRLRGGGQLLMRMVRVWAR